MCQNFSDPAHLTLDTGLTLDIGLKPHSKEIQDHGENLWLQNPYIQKVVVI